MEKDFNKIFQNVEKGIERVSRKIKNETEEKEDRRKINERNKTTFHWMKINTPFLAIKEKIKKSLVQ